MTKAVISLAYQKLISNIHEGRLSVESILELYLNIRGSYYNDITVTSVFPLDTYFVKYDVPGIVSFILMSANLFIYPPN